ncbi:hypothetical protein D3C85_1001440 [compost metagenome]
MLARVICRNVCISKDVACACCWMTCARRSSSTGLTSNSSMPACKLRARSPFKALAVQPMTGVALRCSSISIRRILRTNARPSMPGMLQSVSTRSKSWVCHACNAASPSATASTSWPRNFNCWDRTRRLTDRSSTTNTRRAGTDGLPGWQPIGSPFALAATARFSSRHTCVPTPGTLCKAMRPPIRSTSCLQMLKPNPDPPYSPANCGLA